MARAGGGLKVTGVSSQHDKAFVYNLSIEGYRNYAVCLSGILVHNKAGKEREPGAQGLVTVYGRATLEHYEVSILGASGASALLIWLQGNGYPVNPAARKVLDAYLHEGWSFVAVKLNPAEKRHYEDEFLPPLTIKYRSDHFVFPLRISSISTVQTARITLYVIAESTVSASNLTTKMLAFEKNLPAGADPEEYIEACVQKTTGGERGRQLAVLWSGQLPARVDGKVLDRMMSTPFAEGMPRYLTRLEARMDPAVMTEDIKLSLDQKPKGFLVILTGEGYGPSEDPAGIALVEAVRAGNTEKVQILLAAGTDVRGSYGGNALNAAAGGGRNEIVRLLLSTGAEVRGPSGVAALDAAAQRGHADTIRILLAAGVDAEGTPSPLTSAAGGATWKSCGFCCGLLTPRAHRKPLLGRHAEAIRKSYGSCWRPALTPRALPEALTAAAGEGHTETVQLLLSAGTPVDSKTRFIHIMTNLPHSWSALMFAISNGNRSTVEALLNAGANVNASDEQGMTPIILAAIQWGGDHVACLQLLLDAGAEVNARKKDGLTALMIASGAGDADGVERLLLAGADVNARRDSDGLNALTLASLGGFTEIVKLLIVGGADLEARDMRGRTALMAASEGDIVPFYAEDMEGLPNGGHALIVRAQREAMAAHTEVVRMLLDLGADANAKDNRGWTSLRYAVDRAEIARVLIEAGAKE